MPHESVAFVTCIRSLPERTLAQQPIFQSLMPSLARTVTAAERSKHRIHAGVPAPLSFSIYVCAQDDDSNLIAGAREFRRVAGHKAGFLALHLFFYPSLETARGQAVLQAYADGAKYIHCTYEDATYERSGWLSVALSSLRRGVGVHLTRVQSESAKRDARSRGGTSQATTVVRRNLEFFAEAQPAPTQCARWQGDFHVCVPPLNGTARLAYRVHDRVVHERRRR